MGDPSTHLRLKRRTMSKQPGGYDLENKSLQGDMYVWNTRQMASALTARRVHIAGQFLGLVIWTLFIAPTFLLPHAGVGASPSFVEAPLHHLCTIGIFLLGVYLCYRANGKDDGRDFIVRMVCLALPIGMRVFVVLDLPYHFILPSIYQRPPSFELYFDQVLQIVFLWRSHYWIRVVAQGHLSCESTAPQSTTQNE